MIETVRVSQQGKEQLIRLKTKTKIQNWNVLCRWAFCVSLADPVVPPDTSISLDSNVEMTWRVFGGKRSIVYWALLKSRCEKDGLGLSDDILDNFFYLHLHRGIQRLSYDHRISDVQSMLSLHIGEDE